MYRVSIECGNRISIAWSRKRAKWALKKECLNSTAEFLGVSCFCTSSWAGNMSFQRLRAHSEGHVSLSAETFHIPACHTFRCLHLQEDLFLPNLSSRSLLLCLSVPAWLFTQSPWLSYCVVCQLFWGSSSSLGSDLKWTSYMRPLPFTHTRLTYSHPASCVVCESCQCVYHRSLLLSEGTL